MCDDEAEWREYRYPLIRGDIGVALTIDPPKRPESCCECREALLVAEADRERVVHGRRERELLVLSKRLGGRAHRLDHALDGVFSHIQGELARLNLGNVEQPC